MNKLFAIVCSPKDEICEPYFSWSECDNCGDTLGGNRYDVKYRENLTGEIYEASICENCFIELCS